MRQTLLHTALTYIAVCLSAAGQAQKLSSNRQVPVDDHTASLSDVTSAITSILQEVKKDPAFTAGPQLVEAEFDYQTVTATTASGGLSILGILTIGASRERDATSETDFIYDVPDNVSAVSAARAFIAGGWMQKVKDFFAHNDKQQILGQADKLLPAAIKQAAANMQSTGPLMNPTGSNLSKQKFVVTLAFSVKDDFNGGEDVSSLVVVAPRLSLDHSSQTVQTLKLTFQKK